MFFTLVRFQKILWLIMLYVLYELCIFDFEMLTSDTKDSAQNAKGHKFLIVFFQFSNLLSLMIPEKFDACKVYIKFNIVKLKESPRLECCEF